MKNVINYYYHLFPNDIHQKDKQFIFEIDKKKYLFKQFNKDINKITDIQKMSDLLTTKGIKHNQLIKNMTNNTITYVNNLPYVLLKINIDNISPVILEDIIEFHKTVSNLINEPFDEKVLKKIWMDKVDYFEYQVNQFGIKFPIIRNSFNYFIGLSENAIMLLDNVSKTGLNRSICHYRLLSDMKLQDLYNPIEFILDNKVRDFSEYLKPRMFTLIDIDLIDYYFKYNYITNDEAIIFLSRLLYPTFYFDICEDIIDGANDTHLKKILANISIYEKNLKQIYYYLKTKYKIPEIEWLS